MTEWMSETLYDSWQQRFAIERTLARIQSPYQDIVVVQTASHGRVLILDGNIQVTEADEFVYQEMIAHVPMLAHGAARNVLIVGAGDGGVLRRVLRHRTVQHVTMVEIDGQVIELAREHLPGIGGDAWTDPRATVIVGDGVGFVAQASSDAFDVIIVDSTDPVGVGAALFTEAFYSDCARLLGPDGVVVNQSGVPFMQPDELRDTSRRRAVSFQDVTAYTCAVPTYVGGLMAIGFASNRAGLTAVHPEQIAQRAEAAGIAGLTRYWSPKVHAAAFALPPYIADLLPGERRA